MSNGVCLLERDCAGSEVLLRKEETAFARIKRADWVLQLLSSLGCLFFFFLSLHCLACEKKTTEGNRLHTRKTRIRKN